MTPEDRGREILRDARESLATHGWIQHRQSGPGPNPRRCLVGALVAATTDDWDRPAYIWALEHLRRVISAEYPEITGRYPIHDVDYFAPADTIAHWIAITRQALAAIAFWNDQPWRRKDDVIAMLDKAEMA